MEKFKGLSKREIILIYILIIFAIIALGVMFVIKPALTKASKIDDRYQESKLKATSIESTIRQKDDAQLQIAEYEKKIKNVKKQYQKSMKSEKVDELLTGLILSSGLSAGDMEINGENTTVDNTGESDAATTENDGTTQEGDAATSDTDNQNTDGENNQASDQQTTDNTDATQSSVLDSAGSTNTGGADTSSTKNASTPYDYVKVDVALAKATGSLDSCIALIENARTTTGVRVSAFNITAVEVENDQTMSSVFSVDNDGNTDTTTNDTTNGTTEKTVSEYQIEIAFEVYEVKDF